MIKTKGNKIWSITHSKDLDEHIWVQYHRCSPSSMPSSQCCIIFLLRPLCILWYDFTGSIERRIFVSSDYRPQLLAGTWEKKNWKHALPGDKAFSVQHLEDSEWNGEVFWLSPASLQETDLQNWRHTPEVSCWAYRSHRAFLRGAGGVANTSSACVCSPYDCSRYHNFPLFLPINIIFPGHTKVLRNNGNRLLLSLSFSRN